MNERLPEGLLYKVAARHLLLIFEAYPKFETHKEAILDEFVGYVVGGTSKSEILKRSGLITGKDSLKQQKVGERKLGGFGSVWKLDNDQT